MLDVFGELDFSDVFSFAPTLYWGFPYVGVFRQNLAALEDRLLQNRPKDIEGCRVPTALSVYDATDKELRVLTSGPLSVGIAASAAVPGLMHGVDDADGHRLVDAGVGGDMLGVAGCGDDENVLCINLFLRAFIPQAPPRLRKLLIVDLFGVPFVTPNSLKEKGPLARDAAYAAMKHALETPLPEYAGGPRRLEVNKAGDAPPSRPEAQAHQASFVDLVRS
ncbi:hypothetical protein M885DRAFT_530202 [Pelagophyceae sp. CCMP2097]|nr:hypothetical protein M885DRAFT_530202 [Pelagophyceae sp. CCMP2097]